MAITEHSSSPALVQGDDGDASLTTASFSPPAGSVVVAMVACGWDGATTTAAVSDSSGGVAWAQVSQSASSEFNGMSGVAHKVFAAAPGSITVTVAFTNSTGPVQLDVRVLEGVDTDAPVGDTAAAEFTSEVTGVSASLTTADGSMVYGAASTNNHFEATASGVNTDVLSAYYISHNYAASAYSFRSSSTATAGTRDYGVTLADPSQATVALVEFLEASAGGGITGELAAAAPVAQAEADGGATVSSTASLTAPGAQAGMTAGAGIDAGLAVAAPVAQAEADGGAGVAAALDATAPAARASASGAVGADLLIVTAPAPQVEAAGEVTIGGGALGVAAPAAQADVTADVETPGQLGVTAPVPQAGIEGEATAAADVALDAPSAGYTSDGLAVVAGELGSTAPAAATALSGQVETHTGVRVTAPAPQVSISMTNYGEPDVNYVIAAEERETVVQPDIPRETYYV